MKKSPLIRLQYFLHRDQPCIGLIFAYNDGIKAITKYELGAIWSASKSLWYVPYTKDNLAGIATTFKGIAYVDDSNIIDKPVSKNRLYTKRERQLTAAQRYLLNGFHTYLKGKRYSKSTIHTYTFFMADFVEYHKAKLPKNFCNTDVDRYAENVLAKKGYSISSHRQFVSALKLFIEYVPGCSIESPNLKRPKRSRKLPTVLSQEEVIDLIRCTQNLKHRAIIGLIYSSGLRISELLNLTLSNIDIARMQLHIINAKGRKDRYVVLSQGILPLIKNYIATYKPQHYFVEGAQNNIYTASSIRKFLGRSCKAANITKHVTPHTLRHSYATHLLEQGVGLRHIQELLGHTKPETTMIYTHVTKKDLLEVHSPLDTILLHLTKTQNSHENVLLSGK